ncbi:hypothetical protein JCM33374_g5900 [Metschnikowia sp. JCM 33374]|nr:hypothetical protein JCM33374_g5900 [Metschnikowia sp. JCM 33374]
MENPQECQEKPNNSELVPNLLTKQSGYFLVLPLSTIKKSAEVGCTDAAAKGFEYRSISPEAAPERSCANNNRAVPATQVLPPRYFPFHEECF